jgi:hypothetical protein
LAIDALPGLTDNETRTGAVTANVAEPVTVPEAAVIVAVPCARLVANPPLLTVAIGVAEEDHVAVPVRFCVVPLLYVPVAINCCVYPAATDVVLGVTEIEINTGAVTVNVAELLMVPEVAVIVAVPAATLVANPLVTVATVVFDEVQLAVVVRFCFVPLL